MWEYIVQFNLGLIILYGIYGIIVGLVPISGWEWLYRKTFYLIPQFGKRLEAGLTKKREVNNAILNQNISNSRRNKILFQQIFQFNFPATLATFLLVFLGTLYVVSIFPAPWLISFVGNAPENLTSSFLLILLFFLAKFLANIIEGAICMLLGFGCTFAIKNILFPKKVQENLENPVTKDNPIEI
ncbi:hypothetical protein DSAG12_02611 [Promethearchaeum syntrophicum]|uniref:Uncharacterized protein n=1 Tax=Promethearchaeum syntrophicum TaxID=2594042 RepID=A0A5B9DCL3_9ARCH|nr:hypothetical protein [Candidatus Prometheoarchaeum syntrophicum]QEE16781.1 hypothetical protein DSAG12_02611 [Candidatus Prometheoarchaeum syntrophicum]